jgi:hypothetical protein
MRYVSFYRCGIYTCEYNLYRYPHQGMLLETMPGPISAADQDLGINAPLQYSAAGDQRRLLAVDKDSGRLALTEDLLRQPMPLTVVIKVFSTLDIEED